MKKFLSAIAGMTDLHDGFFFVGLGLLTYGVYQIYEPLAFIVPGSVLTWLAIHSIEGGTKKAPRAATPQGAQHERSKHGDGST